MRRAADLAIDIICAAAWLGGFMVALFGHDVGDRVVGALLWIGLGVGYRLRKIQENTTPVKQ